MLPREGGRISDAAIEVCASKRWAGRSAINANRGGPERDLRPERAEDRLEPSPGSWGGEEEAGQAEKVGLRRLCPQIQYYGKPASRIGARE
jgi:hypothetical protein